MPVSCLSPAVDLSRYAHALKVCSEYYGTAFYDAPAVARATIAAEVKSIYITDTVTWAYAVMRFDRRIGGNLAEYITAIVEGD